jgi:hypothetical protein
MVTNPRNSTARNGSPKPCSNVPTSVGPNQVRLFSSQAHTATLNQNYLSTLMGKDCQGVIFVEKTDVFDIYACELFYEGTPTNLRSPKAGKGIQAVAWRRNGTCEDPDAQKFASESSIVFRYKLPWGGEADRAHGIERGSQLLRYLDAKG